MMSTHKYICLFLLAILGQNLCANEADDSTNTRLVDPLYVQIYGGINKSANENLPWSEFSKYPWSGGVFLGVGEEFSPLWGWRAALRFNHNKSRNVPRCESSDLWGWNSLELFADATLDLSDMFRKRKPRPQRPPFNMKLFAGIGGAYTFGFPTDIPLSYTTPYSRNSAVCFGARAGLTATYALSQRWQIGAELSQNFFIDRFNGVKAGTPLDSRTNLKLGFTYLFLPRQKQKRVAPSAVPVNAITYDNRLRSIPVLPLVTPQTEGTKERKIAGRAFLDFPVNEIVIDPRYRRNREELRRITQTIDSALFDPSIQVRSISLHGYASPESPYSNNTRLAKGRTEALRNFIKEKYNLSADVFHTNYTPEDWDNLRNFISHGNSRRTKDDIWYESKNILETPEPSDIVLNYRNELLEVIDRNIDPDEKERLLKQVGGGKPYKWLHRYVYPGLRHTDYIIQYVVRDYSDAEARKLIYTHPEALSLMEMYRVALSYEKGSDGWRDALLIAADCFPKDQQANYNAACACIEVRRLQDAQRYLKKAGTGEHVQYLQNVINAMEGKLKWRITTDNYLEVIPESGDSAHPQ